MCIEIYRKRAGAKSCLMIEMCLLTISKKYNLKYYKKKKKKRNGKKKFLTLWTFKWANWFGFQPAALND